MKKTLLAFLIWIFVNSAMAAQINKIVFFGDSLTDNGNLYSLLLKIIPKSPPYYLGRFSNGPTWAENVGKFYYDKYYIDYKIYALAGATTIYHAPSLNFISPTTLSLELNKYLIESAFRDRSHILFSIWIGSNDYLFDNDTETNVATNKVIDRIASTTTKLINHGAKHFLFLNLPDLSRTPFATMNGNGPRLHELSVLHNQKLTAMINEIKRKNPEVQITFFDLNGLFVDVLNNPEKYNQKYHLNIKDVTNACWDGGFFLKKLALKPMLESDLKRALIKQNAGENEIDTKAMSEYILNTPTVANAYALGKLYEQGVLPCNNANEHIFWDDMHPTETVHRVLSQLVIESLADQFI